MKRVAKVEVFQITDELDDTYNDQYQIMMTVPVETSFGNQDIQVSTSVSYSEPPKSSAGQRDRFIRVVKEGTTECMKKFKASITHK